jgi:YD repeat-containing protein
MKKVFPFLVLPVLLLIQSCSFTDSKVENDLTKENLKGDVILVYSNGIYGFTYIDLYNENGFLTQRFSGKKSENFDLYKTSYENEKIINIINQSEGLGRKFSESESKYTYDPNGKLISVISDGFSTQYNYNEEGRLMSEIGTGDVGVYERKYYYSNSKLDSTTLLMKVEDDGYFSTYVIDDNYEIIKRFQVKSGEKKFLKFISNRKKNEKKDIIEDIENEFDPEGNTIKTTTTKYEYNYDEKGNWTQKRSIEDGVLKVTESRTIVYKGGDTKIYLDEMESIIKSFGGSNNSDNSNQNDEETESNVPIPSTNNYEQSSGSRSQEVKSKCSTCNGSGKCRECGKTFRKQYYKGNGSYESRNESRPGLVMCNDCFGRGHRQVKRTGGGWEPDEDCYVSGCEDGWRYCRECNNYGNGKNIGQCQSCKGTGFRD